MKNQREVIFTDSLYNADLLLKSGFYMESMDLTPGYPTEFGRAKFIMVKWEEMMGGYCKKKYQLFIK